MAHPGRVEWSTTKTTGFSKLVSTVQLVVKKNNRIFNSTYYCSLDRIPVITISTYCKCYMTFRFQFGTPGYERLTMISYIITFCNSIFFTARYLSDQCVI